MYGSLLDLCSVIEVELGLDILYFGEIDSIEARRERDVGAMPKNDMNTETTNKIYFMRTLLIASPTG